MKVIVGELDFSKLGETFEIENQGCGDYNCKFELWTANEIEVLEKIPLEIKEGGFQVPISTWKEASINPTEIVIFFRKEWRLEACKRVILDSNPVQSVGKLVVIRPDANKVEELFTQHKTTLDVIVNKPFRLPLRIKDFNECSEEECALEINIGWVTYKGQSLNPFLAGCSYSLSLDGGQHWQESLDLLFYETGSKEIKFMIETGDLGINDEAEVSFQINVIEDPEATETEDLVDVVTQMPKAYFVVQDRGVRNGNLTLNVFHTSKYQISTIEISLDDEVIYPSQEFNSPLIEIGVGSSDLTERTLKLSTTGVSEGETISDTYTQVIKNYTTLDGTISTSQDSDTGKYTALLEASMPDKLTSILWQIVYSSTIVEKVVKLEDKDEKALLHVLYQEYSEPTETSIEFDIYNPGKYMIEAYMIDETGEMFKVSRELFIPGERDDDEEIKVGDDITVGCTSVHGEVPIMKVFRLSQDGYELLDNFAMEKAFDKTYVANFTVEYENSFYIFQAESSIVVKKVGEPSGCIISFSRDKTSGRSIPYRLENFSGDLIEEGTLDDSTFGIYYKVMENASDGILTVGNTRKVV